MKTNILLLLLTSCIFSYAQKAPIKFGDIPMEDMKMKIYPLDSSAEAVVLVDYGQSSIDFNQTTGFNLSFERIRRVKIINKEGLRLANYSIPLYHDSDQEEKISNLKVVTYNLENGKISETKATNESFFKEKYDANFNVIKVAWTDVKEGSVLELSYKISANFFFNFQDWEFQSTVPTRWSEYRANIPQYFKYEKFMQGYIPIETEETTSAPRSIALSSIRSRTSRSIYNALDQENVVYQENRFRWVAKNVSSFRAEPHMPSERDYISKINFELSWIKFPNSDIVSYMGSWQDIAKSYWDRIANDVFVVNNLRGKVEELTSGITNQEHQAIRLYDYVKQNIIWTGSERRYPENDPEKTIQEKKGSSAEINLLLASLLEKAGIQVYPVLLSTRDHGFVRESNPLSTQFNYVVCEVKIGEKMFLLDATDKYLPFGTLPQKCLNGRGFRVNREGFQWIELAPLLKTRTVFNADLIATTEWVFDGSIKIERAGYNSTAARKEYLGKGEKEYIKRIANSSFCTFSKSDFQNVNELNQPFKEIHNIKISEHVTEGGQTIYFDPFIIGQKIENPFKAETRNYPVDFGHSFDYVYIAKFTIPEGYFIDELPISKIINLPEKASKYIFSVSQTPNTISITSSLSINKSIFTQEEYPNLREFFSQVVAKQAEQIVLKKK